MPEAVPGGLTRRLQRVADLVQRGALLVVLAALAVTAVAAAYTVQHLAINTSTLDMISEEEPFRRNDIAFREAFPDFIDPIVAVVEAETPEAAEEAAAELEARVRLEAAHVERVARPGSGEYFERTGLLFLEVPELAELADQLAGAQPLLAEMARNPNLLGLNGIVELIAAYPEAAGGPELAALLERMATVARASAEGERRMLSWQSLFSPGQPTAAGLFRRIVLIQPRFEVGAFKPAEPAIEETRRLAAEAGIVPEENLSLRLTGPAVLDHEELVSVEISGQSAALISLTLVSLLLVVGLRSWVLVLAAVGTLVAGLIWTAGFATLAVGHLNLISVAFAVLFVGLGIDFGIHFCLRYREETGRTERRKALRIATVAVGGALFLSALSAAAGFYAFIPTAYQGLAELGLIAGSGMFIALLLSLTLLPAILALLPFRPRAGAVAGMPAGGRTIGFVRSRSRAVLWAALIMGIGGASLLPFLRFDFNPINLTDPSMPSVSTFLEMAADPEGGVYVADVLARDLPESREMAARLAALPEVGRVLTIESFVPEDQETKLGIIDDMAIFMGPVLSTPPGRVEMSAEGLRAAFAELRSNAASLAAGQGDTAGAAKSLARTLADISGDGAADITIIERLNRNLAGHLPAAIAALRTALDARPVALEDVPADLAQLWVTRDGRFRIEASPVEALTTNVQMERFADAVLRVAPTATGVPIVVSRAGASVVEAFWTASLIALAAISVILLVVLRRAAEIFLVLAPLALAAVMTGATATALGLSLNFANVIALPLLLGLGVSSGIHLVLRGREERDEAHLMTSSTPRAVLFSTLTTVASFGSLAVSGHRGMMSMGLLLTIAIAWTLVATLVVLPALMHRLNRRAAHQRPAPSDFGTGRSLL